MIRNRILRHIILLLLSPVLVALGACSSLIYDYGDDPEASELLDTDMILKLNVEARQMISSRADKGKPDLYEPSEGDFEQIKTLRIIILRPGDNGNLIVEGNRQISTLPDGSIEPYRQQYLEFKVKGNQMKTIYLIANEASIPSPDDPTKSCSQWLNETFAYAATVDAAANPLESWTVAMPATTPDSEVTVGMYHDKAGNLLPLTEVFQLYVAVDKSAGASEYHVQESSLFLTRAAAKATFEFDLKDYKGSGVNVTGIRFSGFDNCQYVFPHDTKYSPAKYVDDKPGTINNVTFEYPETEGRFITSFAIPTAAEVNPDYTAVNLSIGLNAASDGTIWGPIYFPESKTATTDGRYKVSVQLDGGEWLTAQPLDENILKIDGCDAISRNTHLRIIIKFNEVDITFVVIEAPFNSVEVRPGFGDIYYPEE